MNDVLSIDRDAMTVRVQAGIRVHDLNTALDREDLALPILGSVSAQSVAGMISTGTHGSSLHHGNLASLVTALRLVTADGTVLELGPRDEYLPAARVGLGALGIITEVTLKVVPAFRLRETLVPTPWLKGRKALIATAREHEFSKVWWIPHADVLQVFTYERTDATETVGRFGQWLDRNVQNRIVFRGLLWCGRMVPSTVPTIHGLVRALNFRPRTRVGRSDRIFNVAMPPIHRETEWALPLERAAEALQILHDLVETAAHPINFIQELRFVKGDDAWMSPAYGRDTVQLGAYVGHGPAAEPFLEAFQAAMMELGGRPHWGKEMPTLSPPIVDRMWPMAPRWRAWARELDPHGQFTNPLLDQVIGHRPDAP